MATVKKLLILSCSTGMGHVRAGEALRLSCEKYYPSVEVVHVDIAKYLNVFAYLYVIYGYDMFSKTFPFLYKLFYYKSDRPFIQAAFRTIGPLLTLGSKQFIRSIESFKPDLILSTHFLPSLILPKNFPIPIDTVITDYHAHAIWLTKNTRQFFVPTSEIKEQLQKQHLKSIASGIPIDPTFFEEKNTNEIKKKHGITNDWPIILIMPIFGNYRHAEKIVQAILAYKQQINIIVVTGKNKRLFKNLATIKQANVFILQTSENVDEWMRIADIIITKAGGLTISEIISLQKPMIIINPIPGQEEYNTDYLQKNGYGFEINSHADLIKKIDGILTKTVAVNKKSYPDPSKIILESIFSPN